MDSADFTFSPTQGLGTSNLASRRANTSGRMISDREMEPIEGSSDRVTVNVRTVSADFTVQISKHARISQLKEEVRFFNFL